MKVNLKEQYVAICLFVIAALVVAISCGAIDGLKMWYAAG